MRSERLERTFDRRSKTFGAEVASFKAELAAFEKQVAPASLVVSTRSKGDAFQVTVMPAQVKQAESRSSAVEPWFEL